MSHACRTESPAQAAESHQTGHQQQSNLKVKKKEELTPYCRLICEYNFIIRLLNY